MTSGPTCSWCGVEIERDSGFRLSEGFGARRAAFCRLEHIVPWAIRGPHWEPAKPQGSARAPAFESCSACGGPLDETQLVLIRHRAEHRVPDPFCSIDHLLGWAKGGGRWKV
jgi:hypothetical protein